MIVQKVLNHNAAIVVDENEEKVAIGSGIAFKKKKHDYINPDHIEKLFVLPEEQSDPFTHLLESAENWETGLIQNVIFWIEKEYELQLDSHSYALLFDHFIHLMKRLHHGTHLVNHLLQEIQTLYPDSFHIAERAAAKLSEESGFSISQDETGFLAMHLYAAGQKRTSPKRVRQHTEILNSMVSVMEEDLNTIFPRRTMAYEGLISHLHVTVKAAELNEALTKAPAEMIEMMREKYPASYHAAEKAVAVLQKEQGLSIPNDESVYIAMHIQRLLSRTE
ncbi:PRD domain-containing protein [Salibacterium aidingense]|uniref:PRD domain-containing protein n=1 Tax=Salibacterium aidingense TaxID=384933 RepID=UPI0004166C7A|nr:PRD domain-containing protein [Salibacterium aidingense]